MNEGRVALAQRHAAAGVHGEELVPAPEAAGAAADALGEAGPREGEVGLDLHHGAAPRADVGRAREVAGLAAARAGEPRGAAH